MNPTIFAVALLTGIVPQQAGVSPIQLIQGLPGFYTPGEQVSFDIELPAVTNLGSYNIDVAMESNAGTAGIDFYFDVEATAPAAMKYIFPSTANFFDAATIDSVIRERVTLTDFNFVGINVAPGVNHRVATVVFHTSPTFNGSLSVYVDASLLILDTPDIVPTPVPGFGELQLDIAAATPDRLTAIPEPASVLLLSSWIAGACVRRRITN